MFWPQGARSAARARTKSAAGLWLPAGSLRARTHPTKLRVRIQPDLRIQIVHALSQLDSCTFGWMAGRACDDMRRQQNETQNAQNASNRNWMRTMLHLGNWNLFQSLICGLRSTLQLPTCFWYCFKSKLKFISLSSRPAPFDFNLTFYDDVVQAGDICIPRATLLLVEFGV